ncbi:MAG: GNAT family N-acetyltransferase [Clostridiales bacterium]|jgi:ribosomal protein S18 acetylase RimI-like enzyme|nr:GNAT family N-acetyltransferase [Clostridiales bacterium]
MDYMKATSEMKVQISHVFVDGFYQWLRYLSKDKERLCRAMTHMFNADCFFVAIQNGEVIGITACVAKGEKCVRLNRREFAKHLGFVRGSIAYAMLHKEFEVKTYPIPIGKDAGAVEFVAVLSVHRGKGVAAGLIQHIFSVTDFREYILEVADTNTEAVRLYTRLGFTEILRVQQKHTKQSGINALVYMKRESAQ